MQGIPAQKFLSAILRNRKEHKSPTVNSLDGGTTGFILPLTLWMIAIFGLLAATINIWEARAVANSQSLAKQAEFKLAQANVLNELIFMLSVRPKSYRGLEVGMSSDNTNVNDLNALMAGPPDSGHTLKFDGRPFRVESNPDIVLSLQDETGLINLNSVNPTILRRALAAFNIPEPQIVRLIDTLLDYIDDDNLTRTAGAEKEEYARLNLPPPANSLLTTPFEAQNIIGWNELDAVWEAEAMAPSFSTCRSAGFNLNTAPARVLIATVRGLTQDKVGRALEKRAQKPFRNVQEFGAAADLLITDEPFFYTFIAGNCFTVDLLDKPSGQLVRRSLMLDPTSQSQPWRVNYEIRISSKFRPNLDQRLPEEIFPAPESIYLLSGRNNGPSAGSQ